MSRISKKARVSSKAKIGENVVIMHGAAVLPDTRIGNNVVIYPYTHIGRNVLILDNCVLGRSPFNSPNLDRKPSSNLKNLRIGDDCKIGANVILYKGSRIGKGVMICDFSSVREECLIGNNVVLGRGVLVNYNVKIGDNTRVMDGCHFGGDMIISKEVFIGPFVSSANDNYMGIGPKRKKRRGTFIRKGAKIGTGSILLAENTIGEGAVIGAGALVNKDIPAHTLAYGLPAKVIRQLK